jgi:hypothetical protein
METQQFSTALEAEYPKCSCEAYPTIYLTWRNANDETHPQKQHVGRAVPPLVAEHAKVISMIRTDKSNMDSKNKL